MGDPPPHQQQCSTTESPPPNGPPAADNTSSPSPASEPQQQEARMHASAAANASAAAAAAAASADAEDRQQTNAPAFWSTTRHARSASYHSLSHAGGPGPIQLEDHSEDQHEQSQGCWARSVTVDDYTVVSGTSGIGAYVVWHCTVRTLKGGDMNIRKRYSEFDRLRSNLVKSFPHAEGSIPQLPRKSVVSRFRPKFLEQRKNGLNHFVSCILLNPEFAASPVLKETLPLPAFTTKGDTIESTDQFSYRFLLAPKLRAGMIRNLPAAV
ncbi:hypothetical protein Q7P37_011543 [Cladosporium fusiforme]